MNIGIEILRNIVPGAKESYLKTLVDTFNANAKRYGLTTPERVAAFIAQVAHESDGLKTTQEYASGAAYEGRSDLGNTQPGDGQRFKGRGFIQTTGRTNYVDTSKALFGDSSILLNNPSLLENPKNATLSAMYFWNKKGLNEIADKADDWTTSTKKGILSKFEYITLLINGGLNGLQSRESYWEKAKAILKKKIKPTANSTYPAFNTTHWWSFIFH